MKVQTDWIFLSAHAAPDFLEVYKKVLLVVSLGFRLLMFALLADRHPRTLLFVPVVEFVYGKFSSAAFAALSLLLCLWYALLLFLL